VGGKRKRLATNGFAALEQPELPAADIIAFFAGLG
jgi:hypothetical protein